MTLVVRDASRLPGLRQPVVATVGNFDGLHRGHEEIFRRMSSWRRSAGAAGTSVVIGFYPHPAAVLGKIAAVSVLTTLHQKVRRLSECDVEILYLLHFTPQFARQSAQNFVNRILFGELNARCLMVGPDAAVGHRREGDVEFLKSAFEGSGREFDVVPFLFQDGVKISSGMIRERVGAGDLAGAKHLLGRDYALEGRVVRGDGRGRQLGFPTANLGSVKQLLPKRGVYAARVSLHGQNYPAVINIGVRPTFGLLNEIVEVHLISYEGQPFYGARLEAALVARLRQEQRFDTIDALRRQIAVDVDAARHILV